MISTNLSTRPFYNQRLVHVVLLVVVVLVLAVTALNVSAIVALSGKEGQEMAQAARAEKSATDARGTAQRIRRGINVAKLETAAGEASEANTLIDARTFSWTQLFSEFEQTLPDDVRITQVTPHTDKSGALFVDMTVVGRRAEDINDFAERLEARGAFTDMAWRQETINAEGLRETVLVGRYIGTARRAK